MLNSALYRRKSETHEQCIGEKVKLYDLKIKNKKSKAKKANAIDVDTNPNTYSIELQTVVMTYFDMPY